MLSSDCCKFSAKAKEANFARFWWALTATRLQYILVGFSLTACLTSCCVKALKKQFIAEGCLLATQQDADVGVNLQDFLCSERA